MREILFRGKSVDNGEWVFGYYTILPKGDIGATIMVGGDELLCEDTADYIVEIATKQASSFSPAYPIQVFDADICEVRAETVGQYTGFTDKNGTKIFEGDIIKVFTFHKERIGMVEWQNAGFYLIIGTELRYYPIENAEEAEMFEVIGNIHDNPEMLEVKK